MKAPKILPYDWVDLTSSEEIDNYFVDKVRQCLCTIRANSAVYSYVYLRRLFDEIGEYLINCPKSDAAVILARLLEGLPTETLRTTTALDIKKILYLPELVDGRLT